MKKFTIDCLNCGYPIQVVMEPSDGLGGKFVDIHCSNCKNNMCAGCDSGESFTPDNMDKKVPYVAIQIWNETVDEHKKRHHIA